MTDTRCIVTRDQKSQIVGLIRRLPAILSGRIADESGIAQGFRSRIAHSIYSLVAPNFDELGRGQQGADGDKWQPLSKAYLAYGRRFTQEQLNLIKVSRTRALTTQEQAILNRGGGGRRFGSGEQAALKKQAGLTAQHHYGPNQAKGLLSAAQYKRWKQIYAQSLKRYILKEGEKEAKSHAAAVAWSVVKKEGAKTKLEVYGNRQVTILRDTGQLRNSLLPGVLNEGVGPDAAYDKPSGNGGTNQIFDHTAYQVVVGSNDKKANWHHNAKSPKRRRRLWPDGFPDDWWKQILGVAISGLVRINELWRQF